MKNNFFLISFIPALAYWYLEENYPVEIAVTGGLILSVIEISLEKYFTKHVHSLSKMNFFLILLLGSLSLFFKDGLMFKLQPFFTGVIIGPLLIYKVLKGNSYMYEMMESMPNNNQLPKEIIMRLERDLGFFLIAYSLFMGFVALKLSTSQWLFYKTAGFYITSFIFMIVEMFFMRKKIKELTSNHNSNHS